MTFPHFENFRRLCQNEKILCEKPEKTRNTQVFQGNSSVKWTRLRQAYPRIFLYALKEAGCPPNKTVMIGDRLDSDIAPAKSIGMRTVRVKRGLTAFQELSNELEKPDYEIGTLEDLPELLNAF